MRWLLTLALLALILSAMAVFNAPVGLLIAAAPQENAAKEEMEQLQGTWQLVALDIFSQGRAFKGPKEEVELEKVIIQGDNWTLRRETVRDKKSGLEIKGKDEQARYQLDATKKPKTIDIAWIDGDRKGQTFPGIFTLAGDTLTVCYAREGNVRPMGFTAEATKEIKGHCVLMLLKREKPKLLEGSSNQKDLGNFQGQWLVLRSERDGKPVPAQVRETFRVKIRGRGLLLTGSDGEVIQEEASFTLDPSQTPKAIDVRDDLTRKVNQGIYLLADDRLTICIDKGYKGRPKEFSSKDGRSLLVLQRAKEPAKGKDMQSFIEHCLKEIMKGTPQGQALGFYHLQNLGPRAKSAVPPLQKMLVDKDSYKRMQAAYTLWKIERRAEAIPALEAELKNKKVAAEDRAIAAEFLGGIGPAAKATVPTLTGALKDRDTNVRVRAAWALWKVTGQSDMARPVFFESLKEEGDFAGIAITSLAEMGLDRAALAAFDDALRADPRRSTGFERAVPALIKALTGKDAELRKPAAAVLIRVGRNPLTALELKDALKHPDLDVRRLVTEVLKAVDPEADRPAPNLPQQSGFDSPQAATEAFIPRHVQAGF